MPVLSKGERLAPAIEPELEPTRPDKRVATDIKMRPVASERPDDDVSAKQRRGLLVSPAGHAGRTIRALERLQVRPALRSVPPGCNSGTREVHRSTKAATNAWTSAPL